MNSFAELDERRLSGALVIIDVDGTLTNDKSPKLVPEVSSKLRSISKISEVHLFSNGLPERTRMLADEHGIHYLDSEYKKPSRRVIERLERAGKRLVVVGDKALTDGLFAANIGAEYIPVRRIRHADDSPAIRAIYLLDDAASLFFKVLSPVLPFFLLMRPVQWVKNALVFAPVFFAGEALGIANLALAAGAAGIFCLAASAMYIYNDIRDVESDRLHPTKRSRPVASGVVTVAQAYVLLCVLGVLSLWGLAAMPALAPVLAVYIGGNFIYSTFLKRVAVIDVAAVALFYVLRVFAGGAATATYISPWIVLCVFFGALFLVIGKRRAEFAHASKRSVLSLYSKEGLDYMLVASATLSVIAYGLYSILGDHSPYVVYSTIFVVIAIFRLVNRIYMTDSGAEYPETLVFKDRWVLLMAALWAAYMFVLFYLPV